MKTNLLKHFARLYGFFVLLSFMLLASICSFAQPGIFINTDSCIGTITRFNPSDNSQVHYMKTGDRNGRFLFSWQYDNPYPLGNGKYRTIDINGCDVKDFTVLGDTIFFCGDYPDGIGFYGYTKMATSSTTSININKLYKDSDTTLTDVRRIRVFYDNTNKHVLLIGTYVCPSPNYTRSAIIDVKDDDSCFVRLTTDEHFDDVEVLEDYVVTVERKGGLDPQNASHYLRVLHKNNFSLTDSIFDIYYYWNRRTTNGRILLQEVGGNNFVSVYHRDTAFFINTYTVGTSGMLSMQRYYSISDTNEDPIRDVAYRDIDSSITVINSQSNVGTATKFSCGGFPNLVWVGAVRPDLAGYCSGCPALPMSVSKVTGINAYRVSGIQQNKMFVWMTNSICRRNRYNRVNVANSEIFSGLYPASPYDMDLHHISYRTTIRHVPFSYICQLKQESLDNTYDVFDTDE